MSRPPTSPPGEGLVSGLSANAPAKAEANKGWGSATLRPRQTGACARELCAPPVPGFRDQRTACELNPM